VRGNEPEEADHRTRGQDQYEDVDEEGREQTESPIEVSVTSAMPTP
jgi:hypothetical protein